MARVGRRPGSADTRGDILDAARATFAAEGYHGATIRAIAAAAGVDPALVHHYFGTKEDLFAACVQLPARPAEIAEHIMAEGPDEAGRRAAAFFFRTWEEPATRDALLTLLRGAMSTEHGSSALREFFGSILLSRVAPHLTGEDVELRISLAMSHLIGAAVLRYVVAFPALRDVPAPELAARIGAAIQPYFTP
jgi:AcrR family transcriptional regulator